MKAVLLLAAALSARAEDNAGAKRFGAIASPKSFPEARCPVGTRAAPASGLQRFRCVREDGFAPYAVPGELSFDYPAAFTANDGWKEEVPMVSFILDDGKPGKPVTLTLTKVEPSQASFVDIGTAVGKDKSWQNAREEEALAGGVKARVTVVKGESKTAYVPLKGGAYYAVAYSAPAEAYAKHLPAFDRLLKSLKLGEAR